MKKLLLSLVLALTALTSFAWTQYTPHWNDGDACTFSAHTDYLYINGSEDSESFWDIARGFRNAGITAYTTIHKDTDITRSGRQCLRAVLLDRPYEESVNFFGVDIPSMECSTPMSDTVTFIDSFDRTVKKFHLVNDWPKNVPSCLIEPVQPTNVSSITF